MNLYLWLHESIPPDSLIDGKLPLIVIILENGVGELMIGYIYLLQSDHDEKTYLENLLQPEGRAPTHNSYKPIN